MASIRGSSGKLREDDQYRRSDCDKADEQVCDQVIRFYSASDDRESHTLCAEWKPQRYAARVQRIYDQVQDHRERCESRVKVELPDCKHDSTRKECECERVRDPAPPSPATSARSTNGGGYRGETCGMTGWKLTIEDDALDYPGEHRCGGEMKKGTRFVKGKVLKMLPSYRDEGTEEVDGVTYRKFVGDLSCNGEGVLYVSV